MKIRQSKRLAFGRQVDRLEYESGRKGPAEADFWGRMGQAARARAVDVVKNFIGV